MFGSGGIKGSLTHKWGPLPVWGWAGIAAGGYVVYRWYQNKQGSQDSGGDPSGGADTGALANQGYDGNYQYPINTRPPIPPKPTFPTHGWLGPVPGRKGYSYYEQKGGRIVQRKNSSRHAKSGA